MNRRVDEVIGQLKPESCDAIEISGTNHANRDWRSYKFVEYPHFDVCSPPPDELRDRYDFVVAEQVLEHVAEPLAALRTMRDLSRPGGTVLVTTPFLLRIHREPRDYWRFTPEGLAYLMTKAGLEVVEAQGWGNRHAVRSALYTWPRRRSWHSLRNEEELPVVVWAVGRNPIEWAS